jgi:hypothetical protein
MFRTARKVCQDTQLTDRWRSRCRGRFLWPTPYIHTYIHTRTYPTSEIEPWTYEKLLTYSRLESNNRRASSHRIYPLQCSQNIISLLLVARINIVMVGSDSSQIYIVLAIILFLKINTAHVSTISEYNLMFSCFIYLNLCIFSHRSWPGESNRAPDTLQGFFKISKLKKRGNIPNINNEHWKHFFIIHTSRFL